MSDLKQIEWDLAGFCTVKALNPLALLSVNQVGFGRISTSNILSGIGVVWGDFGWLLEPSIVRGSS
jgi:hypothetical protein